MLPLSCKTEDFVKYNAVPELPRGIFGGSEAVLNKLHGAEKRGN